MRSSRTRNPQGVLIAEAILAAFLMLFAFAASSSLFDAALRWEAESGNNRRAAMIAEKKMEELRSLSSAVPSGSSFADVLAGLTGAQPDYPEAPGFTIDVQIIDNIHRQVLTSGLTPPPGVHSPCSSMYTNPPDPNNLTPPLANGPDNNPQFNHQYKTYPYTRHLSRSLQMVQVTVTYAGGTRDFRLVSLLGDPITPFRNPPEVRVTISGPNSLSNGSTTTELIAQVVTSSGSEPNDVTVLWGLANESTGSLKLVPLDSSGRRLQVKRRMEVTPSGSSATARLQALVRYGGQEAVGISPPISLP